MKKFGLKKVFSGLLAFVMVLTVSAVALAQVQPRYYDYYNISKAKGSQQTIGRYLSPNGNLNASGQNTSGSSTLNHIVVNGFNHGVIYTRYLSGGQSGNFPGQGVTEDEYRISILCDTAGYQSSGEASIAAW